MASVDEINKAATASDPVKKFKEEAKEPSKKAKKQPKELTITVPLKSSGEAQFPKQLFTLEVGVYEQTRDAKNDGFTQIGIARVKVGLPLPDGTRQTLGFWDHKIEVDGAKRMKLISPMSVIDETKASETPPDKLFSVGGVFFRENLLKVIRSVLREGKARPVSDLWNETKNFKPVIYSAGQTGEIALDL